MVQPISFCDDSRNTVLVSDIRNAKTRKCVSSFTSSWSRYPLTISPWGVVRGRGGNLEVCISEQRCVTIYNNDDGVKTVGRIVCIVNKDLCTYK